MLVFYKNSSRHRNRVVKFINGCGLLGSGIVSFWGCNFKCPFCFAQKYSYSGYDFPMDDKNRIKLDSRSFANCLIEFIKQQPRFCYIQLTGGEPIANHTQLSETIEALIYFEEFLRKEGVFVKIIYQTNGYLLGSSESYSQELLRLKDFNNINILFEISLKGTNPREFAIFSGTNNEDGFYHQVDSYWFLRNIFNKYSNINVVARFGIGHHRRSIHFYDFEKRESFFKRCNWDKEFERLFTDNTEKRNYKRMICECINAEGDGGVNNYVHRSLPAIKRLIKLKLITSRDINSKAFKTCCKELGEDPNMLLLNGEDLFALQEDYQEFERYFERMGDPAHSYCGRNEFSADFRKICNNCRYIE